MKKKMELEAKKDMLHKLKSDMRGEMHKGIPEAFKGKAKKIIVEADSEEGLEKGLSMAQKIMKGKLGDLLDKKDSEESKEEGDHCEESHYAEGGTEEEKPEEERDNTTDQVNKFIRTMKGTPAATPVKEKEDKLKKYYF